MMKNEILKLNGFIGDNVIRRADDISSADIVEVIRCKDCYYSVISQDGNIGCTKHTMEVTENDFCSYGNRK